MHIWLSGSEEESGAVRKGLEEKIDRYAAGELGHAADAISCIWAVSNEDGLSFSDSPSPSRPSGSSGLASSLMRASTTSVAVAKTFLGCDIRGPLIKSIKEGYLLDRKYWVRRSREGAVEPIYFASTVAWADVDGGESPHPGAIEVTESCRSVRAPIGERGPPRRQGRR